MIKRIKIISTHMPLARHDHILDKIISRMMAFLLTCLLRGMTVYGDEVADWNEDFYSHASCEA